jgi:hypothetical protein
MIARPKISRNERKTTEIGAFEVGNFAPFSCPGWDYGAIGGYKFLPARAAPALLYFTETATTGAEPQMHLCPVLGAAGELEREFARHGVPRL